MDTELIFWILSAICGGITFFLLLAKAHREQYVEV